MEDIERLAQKYGYDVMRFSLAITFIWFGLLKVFGVSPVTTIVYSAMPSSIGNLPGFFLLLGLVETAIGIAFILRRFVPYASLLLIIHLLVATVSVVVTQGFSPSFPFLTLEGEFVVKNLALMAGAFMLLSHQQK